MKNPSLIAFARQLTHFPFTFIIPDATFCISNCFVIPALYRICITVFFSITYRLSVIQYHHYPRSTQSHTHPYFPSTLPNFPEFSFSFHLPFRENVFILDRKKSRGHDDLDDKTQGRSFITFFTSVFFKRVDLFQRRCVANTN